MACYLQLKTQELHEAPRMLGRSSARGRRAWSHRARRFVGRPTSRSPGRPTSHRSLRRVRNMLEKNEEELLSRFVNTFTYKHNPSRDFGSNREFYNDLKKALEHDEAYTGKPSLSRVLMIPRCSCTVGRKTPTPPHVAAKCKGSVAPTTNNGKRPALMLRGTPTTSKSL